MAESKAARFARQFGSDERVKWVQDRPCAACGVLPSQNHHHGGKHGRDAYRRIVPLCTHCHRHLHDCGRDTFLARHDHALFLRCDNDWTEHSTWNDLADAVQTKWEARNAVL